MDCEKVVCPKCGEAALLADVCRHVNKDFGWSATLGSKLALTVDMDGQCPVCSQTMSVRLRYAWDGSRPKASKVIVYGR